MTDHDEAEPVDLTPLRRLQLDPERSEALLARIRAAAGPGLERRAQSARGHDRRVGAAREIERALARFRWAALAAAAAAVLVMAFPDGASDGASASLTVSVAQAVTQTDSTTSWIARQSEPTNAELVVALGLENAQ